MNVEIRLLGIKGLDQSRFSARHGTAMQSDERRVVTRGKGQIERLIESTGLHPKRKVWKRGHSRGHPGIASQRCGCCSMDVGSDRCPKQSTKLNLHLHCI